MPVNPWLGLIDASLEAARRTLEAMERLATGPGHAPVQAPTAPWRWTNANRITAELTTMRVRMFRNRVSCKGPAVIVVAPYALHAATTADFAHGHSVVGALLQAGIPKLFVTDWRTAGEEQRYLSIDSYLADLNALVDDVGAPCALVGLCQGGLLAAIYAARFPRKVSRLVLAGAPLDLDAGSSALTDMIRHTPRSAVEELISQGHGVLRSRLVMALWPTARSGENDIRQVLQIAQPPAGLTRRFTQWNRSLVDLPGVFYRQTVDRIFRGNAFARGQFMAMGHAVGLRDVTCPLFLLAAGQDEIVGPGQVLAARSIASTPPHRITCCLVEGRHLSLYMGRAVLAEAWTRIADFLLEDGSASHDRAPRPVPAMQRRQRATGTSAAGSADRSGPP